MAASRQRELIPAVGGAIAAMLCFASVPVFLRHLAGFLDCWTVNAMRYAVAAVFWLPFVVVLSRRVARGGGTAGGRSIWLAALAPTVPNLLGQVGWAMCPYYVDATTIGFVIRVAFLFTTVFGFVFVASERRLARRPSFYVGAATTITGVGLMYIERLVGAGGGAANATGLGIVVATAAAWGAYAVCVRRFLGGYPLRLAFGVISLYTTVPLVVLMLAVGRWEQLGSLPGREWALMLGSGFVGIALGHIFYHRGIHGVGPVVASGVTMVGPFITYALAAAVLGEQVTPLQLCGGVVVVAGGLVLVRARARADRLAESPIIPLGAQAEGR